MSHNHDHNHDHEVITLVDEQGNETLFEILLTIDGREEFGKNYVHSSTKLMQKKTKTDKLKSKLTHLHSKTKMEQKAS